jgi:hypothetical protein
MNCPYCGAELESRDQRFCQFCGAEVPERVRSKLESTEKPSPTPKTPSQQSTYEPPTIPTQTSETETSPSISPSQPLTQPDYGKGSATEAHSYAKKCLAFAIISLGLAVFAFIYGGFLNMIGFIESLYSTDPSFSMLLAISPFRYVRPFLIFIPIGANVIGLIFATTANKYKEKSERMGYADDSVRKVGSVFAIFGIILNIIGLVDGGLSALFTFSDLYSLFIYN